MTDLRSPFFMQVLLASLLAVAVGYARPVRADTNATVAEALFSEGRRLLDEEKYDQACPKFAESQNLDPGTGTLLNLANCYELAGRIASAWSTWKEAAASARDAGQDEREQLAREKADALEARLPKLTITIAEEAKVEGMSIVRNGEELPLAIVGAPLPVDPITHTIEVTAPGYEPFQAEVTLAEAESKTLTIPPLVALPVAPPEEAAPTTDETVASTPTDETKPGKGQRLAGWITGGAGLLAVGVGALAGLQAIDKNDQSLDYCSTTDPNLCSQTGVDLRNEARASGAVSSIGFGIGAAALVTGVVLLVTAPKAKSKVAAVPTSVAALPASLTAIPTLDGGRLLLTGSF